jgi:hypothetical protein
MRLCQQAEIITAARKVCFSGKPVHARIDAGAGLLSTWSVSRPGRAALKTRVKAPLSRSLRLFSRGARSRSMDRSGGYAVGPVLFRYGLGLKAATSQPFVRSFGTADYEPFQALTRGRHLSAFAFAALFGGRSGVFCRERSHACPKFDEKRCDGITYMLRTQTPQQITRIAACGRSSASRS